MSSSLTFPKAFRLTKRRQFLTCYRYGHKYFSLNFILYVLPHKQREFRVGITVTKKVGKAVKRNRIKRLLKEFFRLYQNQIIDADIVVVAKRKVCICRMDFGQIEKELYPVIKKIKYDLA